MPGSSGFLGADEVAAFVRERGVRILTLCHVPEDGRLKTLNFAVSDETQVREILEYGERVDGSSLFSFIDPHKSDIYISPKLETAFTNPFSAQPSLSILCKYLDEAGKPLDVAPENILLKAEERLHSATGVTLKALAELEFFIIADTVPQTLFPAANDRNYHESSPFSRFEHLREEILVTLAEIGIETKYAHSEVGRASEKTGTIMEQHEIELRSQSLVRMSESVAIAKWAIRNVCLKNGVSVSFSPKLSLEHAGNGMHVHLCGLRNGRNITQTAGGDLSLEAKAMIGGVLKFAQSLAAFANMTPVSYLRFLARKESPMNISWGSRNRLALIRVPLWWNYRSSELEIDACKRTFEYRAPDSTANVFFLLAALSIAVEYGLKNQAESLRFADSLHLDRAGKNRKFGRLPCSCNESAINLRRDRKFYEAEGVFPESVVESIIEKLKAYKDGDLAQKLKDEPQRVEKLMSSYLHYG